MLLNQYMRGPTGSSSATRVPSQEVDSLGEWSFDDITEFLSIERGRLEPPSRRPSANVAELKLGDIFYTKDSDSRLHNRVMLVLRQRPNKPYFSCLAMCRHKSEFEELEYHWHATNEPSHGNVQTDIAQIRNNKTIEVRLRPVCHGTNDLLCQLYEDTTIDIWSIWHVAHSVEVMKLGRVTNASLRAIGREVAEVLNESLPGYERMEIPELRREQPENVDEALLAARRGTSGQHPIRNPRPERRLSRTSGQHDIRDPRPNRPPPDRRDEGRCIIL